MQIVAVVANIQTRRLKPDEGKVSMRTRIGHGLVGPKRRSVSSELARKGSRLNIPAPLTVRGNAAAASNAKRSPFLAFSLPMNSIGGLGISSAGE